MSTDVEVLIISKADVEQLLTQDDVVQAVETVFQTQGTRGHLFQPPNTHLQIDPPSKGKLMISMPCYIRSLNLTGIKWTNAYYGGQKPGIPPIWGSIVVLNNAETGIPFAILDDTTITAVRTAGGHAVVAAKYLAKKSSRTMAIIGCGVQGRSGLLAFQRMFPLKTVKIFDIRSDAVASFLSELSPRVQAIIVPANTLEEAFAASDIILLADSSSKPILFEPMVPSGCFVAGLRRFMNLDPALSRKTDKWIIGNRVTDCDFNVPDIGLSYDHVYADMGEIVTGAKPGRENDSERILYTHMGMGAHDVVLGYAIYKKALAKGLGTKVKLI